MDKNELKVQALLERVSEITTTYENRVADLRVELTTVSQELQEVRVEVQRLNDELVKARDGEPDSQDAD